jgi:hypothetical protein
VNEFWDIAGASGALYRFRRVADPGQLPAMAGNFIFLRPGDGGERLVCCGSVPSLIRAGAPWRLAVEQHQTEAIFVRLNVSRAIRLGEHQDIVERQNPTMVVAELD